MGGRAEQATWGNQEIYVEVIRRAGGRILDLDGVIVALGTIPSGALANTSFRRDPGVTASGVLQAVESGFGSVGRRPVLMTFGHGDADVDGAAAQAAWRLAIELPVLVRTRPFESSEASMSASLRAQTGSPADRATVTNLLRRGFAESEGEIAEVEASFGTGDSIDPPAVGGVIATPAGVPSSMAMQYVLGEVAVVAWVATLPEARRQGLGRAVTAAATNAAFEAGAELVTLQASAMGLPVYLAMGYEQVATSRIWLGRE